MIAVEQLTMEFGGRPLFDSISFLVNAKDRIALVGKNGAGKTTLLRLFAGLQQPTHGQIVKPKDLTIGYLPQHLLLTDQRTVQQEVELAFDDIRQTEAAIERLSAELAERTDYESDEYQHIIDKLAHENERLQLFGAANMQAEIEKTLLGLGFERTDLGRQTSEFSGGWRMRIELAKILLKRPDLLLLDEPTNHLDIESIQWLENFLATCGSAVLLVSHDRPFPDAVTSRAREISRGKIYDYKVSYTKYKELRAERREQQLRAYENQQKMIADTEDFIERFRYKATKAVQVQSRIKQLEKLQRLEVDEEDTARLHLKFPPAPHSGVLPIFVEHLTKAYGDHIVLNDIAMEIKRGEKVAFVGKNGEGKSTLVKCIMGEIPFSGTLKLGHQVKIGYFAQNQEAGDKKVKVLSGGERSRLAMIRLLLEPVNLLILDEPTNHLDMASKDVLKEAIRAFDGTAIVVSHDREFLDGLVEKVYEFGHQRVREHLGGIRDFLQYKKMQNLQELEIVQNSNKPTTNSTAVSDNKQNYELQKEQARQIRKQEKLVAEAENEITQLEQQIADMETQFAAGQSDAQSVENYQRTKHALEQKMYEWELLTETLEQLKAQ